jgi:nitrogenase-stabilizing/protective protein
MSGNDTGADAMSEEIMLDMEELCSAEEFLDYFDIHYEPGVVQVNRLHILQRFHDYLEAANHERPMEAPALREHYAGWLNRAYQDFVHSDARTEKVFKVFRMQGPQQVVVPLSELTRGSDHAAAKL